MKFTMYHTCITVFDLKKSMDFYEEALGLHEVRRIEAEDGSSIIVGSSTLVQPKTKFFNLATHWKMGFFYETFCQI